MILFTGGSGLLGTQFKINFPSSLFPKSKFFNVNDFYQMYAYMSKREKVTTIVHAAAEKDQRLINSNPALAIMTNIKGTSNVVLLCNRFKLRLIYISSDYVFSGKNGNYFENSAVNPVNKYGLSKLAGECAVRMYDKSLVIRTSFGPKNFPHKEAFTDQYTTRESVDIIAKKIKPLILSDLKGIIHVGGDKKSVYEYAATLNSKVKKASIKCVDIRLPKDTSLNTSKYQSIFGGKDKDEDTN